ncbi:hypothetical protein WA171_001543, partial [Blastocystis sp. BT1]
MKLFLLLFDAFLFVFVDAACYTFASDCLPKVKQIQYLGAYLDDKSSFTELIIEIVQYNSSDCLNEQYRIRYTETVSCTVDTTSRSDFTCTSVVDNAQFYFGDLNIVEQYNMTCSVKDQNHFVDASESSCQCGNHSMLEQLASMKGVSHRYYMNWMENNHVQIGSVTFHSASHSLCDRSYLKEWIIGLSIAAGIIIVLLVILFIRARRKKQRLERRKRTTAVNLGDELEMAGS